MASRLEVKAGKAAPTARRLSGTARAPVDHLQAGRGRAGQGGEERRAGRWGGEKDSRCPVHSAQWAGLAGVYNAGRLAKSGGKPSPGAGG